MDDALGEEARAQKRHEEDLAALRGGSGSSVAAAAAAPSSQTRAVVPAHNIVATGKPKAQPKRHDYETFERDDKPTSSTSVGDAEEQQHSTVAAPAKRADSWLEQEDKSLPMASGPTVRIRLGRSSKRMTLKRAFLLLTLRRGECATVFASLTVLMPLVSGLLPLS